MPSDFTNNLCTAGYGAVWKSFQMFYLEYIWFYSLDSDVSPGKSYSVFEQLEPCVFESVSETRG